MSLCDAVKRSHKHILINIIIGIKNKVIYTEE